MCSKSTMYKGLILVALLFFLLSPYPTNIAEARGAVKPAVNDKVGLNPEQQINDFSLAGYGEKGRKTWDIHGKTADIFESVVKLQDITGNLFQEKENITLTARRGEFDKNEGKMRLEEDVVITTSSGARLTTNSLEWDRNKQLVSTKDKVNIEKDNLVTTAIGAEGQPDLNSLKLEKEPVVKLFSPKTSDANKDTEVVISCDGPLEINYQLNLARFNNSVKVDYKDAQIYCDTMELYFRRDNKEANSENKGQVASAVLNQPFMGSSIEKLVCQGNVRILRGENISYCEEAIYTASDGKIVLTGRPKLIIYSTQELKALSE